MLKLGISGMGRRRLWGEFKFEGGAFSTVYGGGICVDGLLLSFKVFRDGCVTRVFLRIEGVVSKVVFSTVGERDLLWRVIMASLLLFKFDDFFVVGRTNSYTG